MNLAPNGKPSNLSPEQYKLVRTPEFKEWFGDWENDPENASKVVDSNGEPLVCYHSSNKRFTKFDYELSYDGAIWFTENLQKLYDGEAGASGSGVIYSVFLNIKKMGDWDDYDEGVPYLLNEKFNGAKLDDDYIVFEPEQIKLADGSNTTFDPENPDIRFEDGGQVDILLAPNGKPSNLTPEQYRLVRTPAFKNWFGDWENDPANASKVVDENGEPMQMYHNTDNNKFTIFDKEKLGSSSNYETAYLGFYFSNKYDEGFYGNKTIKCFLNIKNPFLIETGYYADFDREYKGKTRTLLNNNFFKEREYDGILIDVEILTIEETANKVFVAFEPNQIKLADGTNKTFDSENPDIRFDGGGNVPDEFWGNQAGGVLIICSRTNKVLLLKRSPYVQEPETWGMISGKIDSGETIEEAVAREVKEETGWKIDNLIPSYVFKKNDFTFYNFISVVDIEFTPRLDWENTDYGWFDLDNLPDNLHFGVEILLLKENIKDLQVLENKKAQYFKEGGYVKSKKVYVSIKLPYNFEKENEKDIMKSFIRYEEEPFQELQEHKLVGVIGVSKSRENIADWLIFRECLIVMNYDEFMQLNDATEIEYDNPEQLMANDLEIFNRLYGNKREENQDEWNTKFHRRNNLSKILERLPSEFMIAGKKEKDQQLKSELYRIENFTNQYETGKFKNWLEKNNYIINSPQEFVDLIIKYHYSDESKWELSSFYGNTDNLKITSEYIYPIVYKALIKAGSTYTYEQEIIINNRVLNIPNDSQLFFVKKDKSNQDELIEKYKLKDTYRVKFVKQENIDRFRSQIDKKRTENLQKNRELNIQKLQEKANEVLPILLQEIKDNISEYYYSKAKKIFDKEYYKEYEGDDTKYYKVEDIPEVQLYLNNALEIVDYLFKERFYYAKVNDINKYYFSNFNYAIKDLLIKYINDHSEFAWEIDKYHDEYNNSVYSSDFAWTLREIFDYDEPVKELSANNIKNRYIELMDADMFRYYSEKDLNLYKGGGHTIAQTPAPKKERIYGSEKNTEGSSKDIKSAKSIELSEKTIQSIKNKIDEHNKIYPKKKVSLASAKAVVRRGMGAYSVSHRPTITGGKPNSRVAWGLARLNAFLYKIINGKSKSGKYNQDDDLINELGYKVKNYETGGNMEKSELQKGIEVEMEHKGTILKIMSGKYSVEQCAEMIAKDHLKENDKYYTHLLEMEGKFDDGGYVIDEEIAGNNIQNPVIGMAVIYKDASNFDSVKYVLDIFDDGNGIRVGDDASSSGISMSKFKQEYRPATQEEVNRSKQMSKSLLELLFKEGGQTPAQDGLINRIPKNYNIELDYKIGQSFQVDVIGGTTTAYIKSFDFSVDKMDGKPKLNRDSYRIHYVVNGREESSHYSYLKNLKQEKNKITLEVPYSLDGGIFFENSEYEDKLKLLNGKVNGFKIHYYGDRSWNNKWFTYYVDVNGKSYNIDSKDAYSGLDNYVSRVSNDKYFQKDLQKFTTPKGGKLKVKLDYKIGQKIKIATMGGYEEAEIVGMEINAGGKSGEVFKNSIRSNIEINSKNWERPYEYNYQEFEEYIREKRIIIDKIVNEIQTDVKVLFSEKYLTIHRYMDGSKLRVEDLSSYVLKINNSSVKVGYVDTSGDTYFDIFTSMDDFKKQIISNDNFKNGGQTPAQQEKIAKVMGEFKRGELNTSYGTKVTDDKQAIAIALSEAGVSKKEGGGRAESVKYKDGDIKLDLAKHWYEKDTEVELVPVSELVKFREFDRKRTPKWNQNDSNANINALKNKFISEGIKEPLYIEYSHEDKMVLLVEGNHRLNSAIDMGLEYLPATVRLKKYGKYDNNRKKNAMSVIGVEADEYGYISSNLKPSQVGIQGTKPLVYEEGGVIEGQLHSECNDDSGCGEKFDVGGVGHIIEAERDEAVIVSNTFKDQSNYKIKGTPSQIASALNVLGGGKNFDGGAIIIMDNGKQINTDRIKKETSKTDVKDDIESGSIIINRRSMYDNTIYEVEGTPKQIASAINSINGFGVVIEDGARIKEA